MQKFLNIVCRAGGLRPGAVVLVATARRSSVTAATRTAGRMRSNAAPRTCRAISDRVRARAARRRGRQPVPERHGRGSRARPQALAPARCARPSQQAFERGGEGAASLAEAVVDAADHPNEFEFTYPIDAPIEAKIEAIATRVYGAGSVMFLQTAKDKIKRFAAGGLGTLPICMAKTHLSLSHDPRRPWADRLRGDRPGPPGVHRRRLARRAVRNDAECRASVRSRRPGASTSTRTAGLSACSSSSFLDAGLKEFLDAVPARTPAPGGGAVAVIAASLAAGLTAMAARFAPDEWERRAEVVGRAEELRARVEPLADADAEAYGAFMADRTDENVERIIAIPFELAEIAAEVAELAALVAAEGNPNVTRRCGRRRGSRGGVGVGGGQARPHQRVARRRARRGGGVRSPSALPGLARGAAASD